MLAGDNMGYLSAEYVGTRSAQYMLAQDMLARDMLAQDMLAWDMWHKICIVHRICGHG